MRTPWFRLLSVLVLVLALTPVCGAAPPSPIGSAGEAPPSAKPADTGGVTAAAADTYAADIYEAGAGDGHGTSVPFASLRDITSSLPRWDADTPGWGRSSYVESHTIDTANTTDWDEDWVKFQVSASDFDWTQLSYRFDAWTQDVDTDLVLDIYKEFDPYNYANSVNGADPLARASNDDARWGFTYTWGRDARWSSVSFIPTSTGTYYLRVRPYNHGSTSYFSGHAGRYQLRARVGQVERLAGATRVETALRVSQETWPTLPSQSMDATVVLAYSMNYPDALAAAGLAGASAGPILLTPGDHLPMAVRDEILRVGAKGVYVIGGTGVIQNSVIEDLQVILPPSRIRRIAGANRYATSVEALKETRNVCLARGASLPNDAFLVSGLNYPDALAVGPIAFFNRTPVLLTPPSSLDASVASAIAMYGIQDVIIAGGTGAVGATPAGKLIDIGVAPNRIHRIAGRDRYETAKEVAAWACDLKGPGVRGDGRVGTTNNITALAALPNPDLNAYASGESYPDALAGAAFAGRAGAPILLTPSRYSTAYLFGADGEIPIGSTQWFSDLATNGMLPIRQSYLLGGSGAVSNDAWLEIDQNTGWDPGFS